MRVFSGIVVFAVLALGPGPSVAQENPGYAVNDYAIGKGDVLDINVWREPMLSGEAIVRSDGKVSVTLAGDIEAVGRTTTDLKREIQQRLAEFIEEPAVTVIVRTLTSQKYYVIGEVRTSGEYDLVKDLTLVQAIAKAGGFTEWASKNDIVLLRKENGVEKRIRINYKNIVKGKSLAENLELRPNDTIVVP